MFLCENDKIPEAVGFVSEVLESEKVDRKERSKILLKFENALEKVIGASDSADNEFTVRIVRLFSQLRVVILYKGTEISEGELVPDLGLDNFSEDEETENILKKKLVPILSENIRTSKRYGTNRITISGRRKKMNRIIFNIICVILGILAGLLIKAVAPQNASNFFANEILGTIITAFFNLLKMIVAPLVFFSIVTGISGFVDTRELGKISIKAFAYFVVFSIIGLFIGLGVFAVLPSGNPDMMSLVNAQSGKVTTTVTAWQSFKNLILSFFPSNMLGAFVNNEILAVILLAVLIGICISKMQSELSEPLSKATNILNELMCRLASTIVKAMPLIIFCSMAKIVITVELSSAAVLLKLFLSFFVGILVMFGIYCIVMLLNGISPAAFFKGYSPTLLTAVTLASSSATVPVSLKCCTDNLKIPPIITYFVIPLGSTINMNGSCILLTLICLFTARIFGIELTVGTTFSVLSMILLLSMAAPGVPGSLVIMLASILPMMGIPSEAAQLTVCLSAFVGMLLVPVNCTGDAVTAMLIQNARTKEGK